MTTVPAIPTRRPWYRLAGAVALLTLQAAPVATVCSLIVTTVAGIVPAAAAYFAKLLIDELTHHAGADGSRAVLFAVFTIVLSGVSLAAGYVGGYLSGYVQQAVLCLAEDRLYTRVNSFIGLRNLENPEFHDRLRLAERAAETAPQDVTLFLFSSAHQVSSIVVYMGLLFTLWPPMTGLLMLAAIPALIVQVLLSRQAMRAEVRMASCQRRRQYFRGLLMDPSSAKEIRLFGLGPLFHARMMSALHQAADIEIRQNRRVTARELIFAAFNVAVSLTGVVVVVHAVLAGHVTIGDLSLFLAALASTQGAFSVIIPQFGLAHKGLQLFSSYLDVVEALSDLLDGESNISRLRHGIEIRDLWFRYDDTGPWVLRGATFTIPAGRSVGLVGANGAGKTTLVKLLLRLYDPAQGLVIWDGVDLARLRVTQLRQQIRVTSQDFVAFDLSAAENIGLGDLDRLDDRERIRAAASLARVDDTLDQLSAGYDTLLSRVHTDEFGRIGTTLSGGQWQKVAIARALMRKEASLLILDEPSSGLDAEAEYEIHRALADHQPYTKLLISHRLNAIRDADIIVVLSDGKITEQGTHEELLRIGGEYARLFALQATGYKEAPTTAV
ncbi:MAG: ABC transporter ATP-binding protein [Streptosporangiaceae bacterium]